MELNGTYGGRMLLCLKNIPNITNITTNSLHYKKGGKSGMEFKFGNGAIVLPPLHITIIAIIILFFLVRWSKQLETRRFTVFFYFLISTYIAPIYSQSTKEGVFQLWIPLGFIV